MTAVVFTDDAIDDLRRVGPDAVPRILHKLLVLEANPQAGAPLVDELSGYRKLVVGNRTWRIVYRIADVDRVVICEVWAVGLRQRDEVYRAASARVKRAALRRPELVPFAKVVANLGRLAGDVTSTDARPRAEPVPSWLYERLIATGRYRREQIAAMSAEEAFETWNQHISKGAGRA
ncbi:MAG: type II toxin-antitoxin system RelE/ParE family toxin [Candidatus Dormiibacterota bacterium]